MAVKTDVLPGFRPSIGGRAVHERSVALFGRRREGNNRVEFFASNGTGRKGNCSYADANTGEIRVEGMNNETQSWRDRGGAGSSASIIVKVR